MARRSRPETAEFVDSTKLLGNKKQPQPSMMMNATVTNKAAHRAFAINPGPEHNTSESDKSVIVIDPSSGLAKCFGK